MKPGRKSSLQRLKPVERKYFTSELKLRSLNEKTFRHPVKSCALFSIRPSGPGAFGEAGDGGGFGVVDVEDGEQLGDLQDFLEFAAEMAEAERRALTLRAVMRGYQRAETRAVDEGDVVHVEDDFLFTFGEQAFYFFAQGVALFSQNNAAVQRHHGHAIHFAIRHLQCHVRILLKLRLTLRLKL